ncbi:MAG TPA: hypothetical protein VKG82_00440 [Solirubrobacteraceae bacterium]|nr:hypothetical protein [Solirubrobacteraceae bacterium]
MPERPRVTGHFEDANDHSRPLFFAIGRAVVFAAGLERNLQLELMRLIGERAAVEGALQTEQGRRALSRRLDKLDEMTAGQLLKKLRTFGLPAELEDRIEMQLIEGTDWSIT